MSGGSTILSEGLKLEDSPSDDAFVYIFPLISLVEYYAVSLSRVRDRAGCRAVEFTKLVCHGFSFLVSWVFVSLISYSVGYSAVQT